MTRTPYVNEWLIRADEDLRAAEVLLADGALMNSVCFHCQQAAEKFLKGLLAAIGQHVRKSHDLELFLQELRQHGISVEVLSGPVELLSQYYIETRYPADLPTFTANDAEAAIAAARTIQQFARQQLSVTVDRKRS